MKEYDLIVIGSGAGLNVVEDALSHGVSVALVDKGPLGGTCLNLGCIPSKMLIYPSDRVVEIADAAKLGIEAEIRKIDFKAVMQRMRQRVQEGERHVREGIRSSEGLDFYEGEGRFVKDYTLEVNGERIRGRKVVIASGARPEVPPLGMTDADGILTSESLLRLQEKPKTMIIIGGGYIAAEYAHFFTSMGTTVTLLQRDLHLVPDEEPEISELLQREMGKRMAIHTGTEAVAVRGKEGSFRVTAREKGAAGETEFTAEKVLLAAGRVSNADLLRVELTGVETDERNYIKVNEYLETSRKDIWAFGDAIGKKMFRHVANRESSIVVDNVLHDARGKMDYLAAPHAVFSYPEIASVGLTEADAIQQFRGQGLLVGKARYAEVARGEAMREETGFAKAIVMRDSGRIIGFHIVGPFASILIHEVIVAMANDLDVWALGRAMHIHPALSEVIIAALSNLSEVP